LTQLLERFILQCHSTKWENIDFLKAILAEMREEIMAKMDATQEMMEAKIDANRKDGLEDLRK
jgi:hypothetical protein